jgi:outer membrane protein OmpA-like peptidoglycan-associated protein
MKQLVIGALALGLSAATWAQSESKMPEHIGFGSGALLGGSIAGPVGVVVGGTLGTLIGHDVVNDRVLAKKNAELSGLHQEIGDARQALASVNAERAKAQAELAAFRDLLSELSVAVHFETDSAMTASRYRQALQAIAHASQQIEGLTIELVGHTDPTGAEDYNQALSEARARSVGEVLVTSGAPLSALSTQGLGEQQALTDGACGFYALDRRVDLTLGFQAKPTSDTLYSSR